MSLRIPGLPATVPLTLKSTASAAALPDIYEADPEDARPSVAIIGRSGSGKTEQLKRLLLAGYNGLIVAVESKQQILAALRPKILPISAPVKDGTSIRPATSTDKYNRLMRFRDELRAGNFREHNGKPIDFIGFDGLMEIGSVVKAHKFGNVPASKTGEQNMFRAWDELGEDIIDFVATCREAASDAGKAFGYAPIGIVATCGEMLKDGEYKPILPGNKAPLMLPFQFELILRLDTELDGDQVKYIAYTAPGETFTPVQGRWSAKAPGGLFPVKVENPDLGEMYKQMVDYYQRQKGETE